MAEIIRMPRLSDTMEEGVIVSWLKKEGDSVAVGDILAEVETDKATMELESFYEGTLLHIGVKEGAVPVDAVIAIIGNKDEDYKAILAQAESTQTTSPPSEAAMEATKREADSSKIVPPSDDASEGRIKASPLAKKMAKEAGISLEAITGTGEGGRIVKADILKYQATIDVSQPSTSTTQGGYTDKPISQMRKTIAKRLSQSKFELPHFYLTMEIGMDRCWEARKRINAHAEHKISFNDIIIKACALALKKHPAVNSSWLGDKIRTHHDVHIGVAVAVEDGLFVPVIRHADQKPLSEIHTEVAEKAKRARDKKLGLEEMQGNSFSISNLGMMGIEEFTAIINPPDACILAVGAILDKAVVRDGTIVISKQMKVTLSCDHRLVDGATGAAFLNTVRQYLEEPLQMLA